LGVGDAFRAERGKEKHQGSGAIPHSSPDIFLAMSLSRSLTPRRRDTTLSDINGYVKTI
jgi:hypothetical protein